MGHLSDSAMTKTPAEQELAALISRAGEKDADLFLALTHAAYAVQREQMASVLRGIEDECVTRLAATAAYRELVVEHLRGADTHSPPETPDGSAVGLYERIQAEVRALDAGERGERLLGLINRVAVVYAEERLRGVEEAKTLGVAPPIVAGGTQMH